MSAAPKKTFKISMSERCFRFKPDALVNHAPPRPGVYEFVAFDADKKPRVLFVGLALERGVRAALGEHLAGQAKPTAEELFGISQDIYFDYVAWADIGSTEDLKDIAGALIAKHRPKLNSPEIPSSGLYAEVAVEEVETIP